MSKKYRIDISDDEMIVYGSVYRKDLKIIYKFSKHFGFTHIRTKFEDIEPKPSFIFIKGAANNMPKKPEKIGTSPEHTQEIGKTKEPAE
jgi:hypothetical protein